MRIDSLDYLRGLMALLIMLYHYFSWTFGTYLSDSFLGVFGIYGVSTFYVLSGLTLYLVYCEKLNLNTIHHFFTRRFFRIFPLLWLSIFLTIFLLNKTYDLNVILFNVTGVFGFIAPDKYIPTGAWSIGNELVFYAIFPIILIGSKKLKYFLLWSFIISLSIGVYYAFFVLTDVSTLQEQWKDYINPFNQLFLFVGGMCIGKYFKIKSNAISLVLFAITISFFVFYPADGNKINITSGLNRMLFSFFTLCLTLAFFGLKLNIKGILKYILKKLGHISYSVYLIHPIVFWYSTKFLNRAEEPMLFLTLTISITMVLSWLVYELIESKFIKWGRLLSSKE